MFALLFMIVSPCKNRLYLQVFFYGVFITLIICIKPDTERHYHDQIAQVYDPDRPVKCKILFKYRCIKRGCL